MIVDEGMRLVARLQVLEHTQRVSQISLQMVRGGVRRTHELDNVDQNDGLISIVESTVRVDIS